MDKLKLVCLSGVMFWLINSPIVTYNFPSPLSYNPEAWAKGKSGGSGSSGGRSRGGSFSAPSKSAPKSGDSSDSPTNSNSNNNNNNNQYAPGYRPPVYVNPNPVIVTNGSSSSEGDSFLGLIFLLILGGGSIALLVWWLGKRRRASGAGSKSSSSELDNDIVTVTCLQIALLASAREIQSRLIDIATESDLTTPEGLVAQLQESVLALLRTPENWTHGRSTSQTVPNLQEAETLFEQISITERQKFAAETLVNVGGKIRRQAVAPDADPESDLDMAEYIVVTLLIGTADDQPLFSEIHTEEDLKNALSRLGAISPAYLMIFELLWTPTEEKDTLTYDQLLTNYADLRQLV